MEENINNQNIRKNLIVQPDVEDKGCIQSSEKGKSTLTEMFTDFMCL